MPMALDDKVSWIDLAIGVRTKVEPLWSWPKSTVAEMVSSRSALGTERIQLEGIDQNLAMARGTLGQTLHELNRMTAQGVGTVEAMFDDDPAVKLLVAGLDASGESQKDILQDAEDWLEAWGKLPDQDWAPSPTNTRTALAAKLAEAKTQRASVRDLLNSSRLGHRQYAGNVTRLFKLCREWKDAACLLFAEGTPEGDLVRSLDIRRAPASAGPAPTAPPERPGGTG